MTEGQIATQWFDQFPPLADGAEWSNTQWCPRHWAPAVVFGANGMGAAIEVMQTFVNEIAPAEAKTPDAMNQAMHNAGRLCCTLGDVRMYEIWGHWPPTDAEDHSAVADD